MILIYIQRWQLTSLELLLMLGFLGLGFLLMIRIFKIRQEKLIVVQNQQEKLKGYAIGNALRSKSWLKGLSSLTIAISITLICSAWTFFEKGNGSSKNAVGTENRADEQTIKMIGAISVVQTPDAQSSSFLSSPAPSDQKKGYDDEEDCIKMTSYTHRQHKISILDYPLAAWGGQQDTALPVPIVPEEPSIISCQLPAVVVDLVWQFPLPDLLDNVDHVDMQNNRLQEQQKILDQAGKHMPLFPGCEEEGEYFQKRACSAQKIMNYIQTALAAAAIQVQDRANVSFVVNIEGKVGEIRVEGFGETDKPKVVTIISALNQLPEWTPGLDNDVPVRTQCIIPLGYLY